VIGEGIAVRRVEHLALSVRDLEASVDFYTGLLGLRVSDRMPYPPGSPVTEGVWLRCGDDHHCLVLFGLREPGRRPEDRGLGLHHFAFEVGSFEELLAAHRTLRERRLDCEARIGGPGWQVRVYFRDPDGNEVELYWDMDRIGWEGRSRPYVPIEVVDLEAFDLERYVAFKAAHGGAAAPAPVSAE
jgi:catechol 2,3-dioxygenase-like lactoylglutathione lyase family enzyme